MSSVSTPDSPQSETNNTSRTRRYFLTTLSASTLVATGCISRDGEDGSREDDSTDSTDADKNGNQSVDELPWETNCELPSKERIEPNGESAKRDITEENVDDFEIRCIVAARDTAIEVLGDRIGIDNISDKEWVTKEWRGTNISIEGLESPEGRILSCPDISFATARDNLPIEVTIIINPETDAYQCTHPITLSTGVVIQE